MHRLIFALVLVLSTSMACANCPVSDALVQKYGVSTFGFSKDIPRSAEPKILNEKHASFIFVELNGSMTFVYDGFVHNALIVTKKKRAWILRTGGFAGVHEWYGPVRLKHLDFTGCDVSANSLTKHSQEIPKPLTTTTNQMTSDEPRASATIDHP